MAATLHPVGHTQARHSAVTCENRLKSAPRIVCHGLMACAVVGHPVQICMILGQEPRVLALAPGAHRDGRSRSRRLPRMPSRTVAAERTVGVHVADLALQAEDAD
jgi:hypothetical protein